MIHKGKSALFSAIESGFEQKARMLIDAGAKLDAASADGVGLLSAAVVCGASNCVRLLLAEGVDPDDFDIGQWQKGSR